MKKMKRELGLFSVCAIACGAMLSGLFVLPGHAAKIGGPSVYLAFMVAGLLFIPAAFSKAEMATALPEAGGDYIFIDRAFGPLISTITGMGTWLALMLKSAFALVGLSAYLFLLIDIPPSYLTYFACGVGVLLIGLNCVGVKKTGQLQSVLVVVSLLMLVVFVERGAIEVQSTFYEPFFSEGWLGFVSATAFVFVSYAGVTKVASAAEEVEDPGTNIPWGMLLSLTIMTLLYTAVVFVTVGVIPMEEMAKGIYKNAPIAQAAGAIAGDWGEIVISVVAILSLAAMANAGLLASSRYPLAMARYDQLPETFNKINPNFGTPILSIIVTGISILLSIIFLPVVDLAKLASAFMLLVFALVNLSVIIFREGDIEWYQPEFESPLYPYIQLFGIVSCSILIGFMGWLTIGGSLVLIGLGLAWYYGYVRRRAERVGVFMRPDAEDSETIGGDLDMASDARTTDRLQKKSVIVPFIELEEEDLLMFERRIQLGAALCGEEEHLDVVHFEEVAEQSLLSEHESDEELNEQLEERIRLLQQDTDVTIRFDVVVTHYARAALREYAEADLPHWMVYEWNTPSPWQFLLGKDWWLEDFPTNLVFFRDNQRVDLEDVLVVTEPGPYDGEILEAANLIATYYDGRITFLEPDEVSGENAPSMDDYHEAMLEMCQAPASTETLSKEDWVENVVERSRDADLLIMSGFTEESFSRVHDVEHAEEIAERADCSVIRVRSNVRSPRTVLNDRR